MPYGADLSYNFKAEGDGTYGMSPIFNSSENYWSGNSMFSQPTNYNQWANPFGQLGSAVPKAMGAAGSMGGVNPMLGFNMAQTMAGMAAINSMDESRRRQIDWGYYNLGDQKSREINARNWLGEGTLLDEAKGNLNSRNIYSDFKRDQGLMARNDAYNKWQNPPGLAFKIPNLPY